jgi:2-C-methyl-D-erythritol 2,4-cyclodiphosphate synthase
MSYRTGIGYDIHRLVKGRALILAGVQIEYARGLLGHSDADVLTHAVIDALLGAAGLPDIGEQFPDTDPRYKGASSIKLLAQVKALLRRRGYAIVSVDTVIVAQEPPLSAYKGVMTAALSRALGVPRDAVGVKAKTNEGLDATGSKRAIASYAVALLKKSSSKGGR